MDNLEIQAKQPILNIGMLGHVSNGKCLAKDTLVMTSDGPSKFVQDMKVGDKLMAYSQSSQYSRHTFRTITGVTSGQDYLFKIQDPITKRVYFKANSEHILTLMNRNTEKVCDVSINCFNRLTVEERQKYLVIKTSVNFPKKEYSFCPVFVGICVANALTIDDIHNDEYKLKYDVFNLLMYNNGLPPEYKYNSHDIRLRVLAGLFIGLKYTISDDSSFIACKVPNSMNRLSNSLYNDFKYLLDSLNIQYNVMEDNNQKYASFDIVPDTQLNTILNRPIENPASEESYSTFPFELVKEPYMSEYYGFELDGDGRFVLDNFIVTHNSTITKQISGTVTQRHQVEVQTNKTVNLGYANAKIYKCNKCEPPQCYQSRASNIFETTCEHCDSDDIALVRHVSFVDCPGHNMLMATMLNGTCVMDGSILVESSSNKNIPAPQTAEHLVATEIMGLQNSVVCFNKLDLVEKSVAQRQINKLQKFLKGTSAEKSPIIPMSANFRYNMDVLCEYICTKIPMPQKNVDTPAKMIIIRSFNVNKQSTTPDDMVGGVVGGSIKEGTIKVGVDSSDEEEEDNEDTKNSAGNNKNGASKWSCIPLKAKVTSINSEDNKLDYAVPGGLIGVGLTLDPSLTAKNRLIGQVLSVCSDDNNNQNTETSTECKDDYKIFEQFTLDYNILTNVEDYADKELFNISKGDNLIINCNASNVKCVVKEISKVKNGKKKVRCATVKVTERPVCVQLDSNVAISKSGGGSGHRLIGLGTIRSGLECAISD
jgi:translation initiation factor 2 subunit 3